MSHPIIEKAPLSRGTQKEGYQIKGFSGLNKICTADPIVEYTFKVRSNAAAALQFITGY